MDIGTIIGLAAGTILLLVSILMGGSLGSFINIPSLLIVVGGSIAATLINYPMPDFLGIMKVIKNAFMNKASNPTELIEIMGRQAEIARRDGLLALEKETANIEDPFLKAGLELAIDGMDLEQIESILSMEMEMLEERHKRGQEMFRQLAKYAPAFGMMGTLIGLIQMLKNVNDPSAIGPGMAVALLTTFYGTLVANLICLPLSGKLEKLSQNEQIAKSLVLEGIKAIQMGDSPKLVEKKLRSFLPTTLRLELDAAA